MSTANKLSYLNDTKSLLRTSLNKFGSSILSTDTFRSYDTKLNDIYDKLPKITQSGAGFTLENVQNGQVDDFKMIGTDLEQNTTTGKQLFDINSEMNTNSLLDAGITSTFNEDGTITVNGEKTANYKYIRYYVTLPAGTYYFCGCPSGGSNSSYSSLVQLTQDTSSQVFDIGNGGTFTLTEQTTIQYFPVRVGNASLTFNNTIFRPMISTSPVTYDDFEKYTGGIPSPNPDYPQDIKVVEGRQVITDKGKNLFDKDNAQILNGYIKDDNGIDSQQENWSYLQSYVPVLPNTTYTISGKLVQSSNNIRTYYYDNSKNWISKSAGAGAGINIFTFTTPNNCYYIQFQMNTDYYDINSIQIEEDSTATDYEPYYNPVSYNIDLRTQNLSDGVNENYWINTNADGAGKSGTNSGLAIDVSNYNEIIIDTSSLQTRYRVACTNTLPTSSSTIGCYRGVNKDNTSSSITINTTGYNYLIINATDLTKLDVYYNYELAKMPNTTYKNKIYKNNGNWYFEENVRKYIIDGTESWITQSAYSGYYRYMFVLMENYKNDNLSYGVVGMNSHFIQRINQPHGDYEYLYLQAANNNLLSVYIQIKNLSTIANFKTWLSENNVVVWYVLANPVTTQITNTTLINQLEAISVHTGTNIITISNDNNIIPEIEITRLKELEKLS